MYLVCSSRLAISQSRRREINNPHKIFNPIKSALSRLLRVFLSLPTGIWQIHLAELKVINVLGRRGGVRMFLECQVHKLYDQSDNEFYFENRWRLFEKAVAIVA